MIKNIKILRHQADRFWSKVQRRTEEECWDWVGPTMGNGYGTFQAGGMKLMATRVAWVLEREEKLPSWHQIRRECGNPSCVNPAHVSRKKCDPGKRDKKYVLEPPPRSLHNARKAEEVFHLKQAVLNLTKTLKNLGEQTDKRLKELEQRLANKGPQEYLNKDLQKTLNEALILLKRNAEISEQQELRLQALEAPPAPPPEPEPEPETPPTEDSRPKAFEGLLAHLVEVFEGQLGAAVDDPEAIQAVFALALADADDDPAGAAQRFGWWLSEYGRQIESTGLFPNAGDFLEAARVLLKAS